MLKIWSFGGRTVGPELKEVLPEVSDYGEEVMGESRE